MFRRETIALWAFLRQGQRHTWALLALVVIPAFFMGVNVVWPPENYAYLSEQFLLLVLALGALLTARATATGAVFLYCSLALLPVGEMLERHAAMGGEWSALALVPIAGVFVVAVLTRDYLATLAYGLVAIGSGLVYGLIYNDLGQGGALAFVAGLGAFWALRWVECTGVYVRAEIERIRQDTGELGTLVSEINSLGQEILGRDPRR